MHTDHTSEMMGKTDGSSSDTLIKTSKYRHKYKQNILIYDILNSVQKSFYATDFKLKKKHKIEETDQPSLKKYIEEVKRSGMQFFSFSSIIHDTT